MPATIKEGGSFETFNDPQGNSLISLNRDGTISTRGLLFPNGTIQISASSGGGNAALVINAQTGTSYAIQSTDEFALVTFNSASAVTATIAQAGGSFSAGWYCYVQNLNSGLVTITPTTSTINGWPQIVLAQYQWALIVSDGTNYDAFFTKIASTDAASALSSYLQLDAGTAAAGNQIVMQDLSASGNNLKRKALNIYLETEAQFGSQTECDALQANLGVTITANTSTASGYMSAAEFIASASAAASGSTTQLPRGLSAVRARTKVDTNTNVAGVNCFFAYLPIFSAGSVTGGYVGFNIDAAPTGAGTVTTAIGVQSTWNTGGITCTNSFGGVFGGGNTAVSAALVLDDTTNAGANPIQASSIVWGDPFTPTIHNGIYSGTGTPQGAVTANPGSMYLNKSGGSGTTLYVKESGANTNTGWVAK